MGLSEFSRNWADNIFMELSIYKLVSTELSSTELKHLSIYYCIISYAEQISLQGMPRQLNTHQKDKPNNL